MNRGEIWWADLPPAERSEPRFRRPVLIVQANDFNRSKLNTVICVILTSNTQLAQMPGNVLLSTKETNLPKESTANVTQVITLDKSFLTDRVSAVSASTSRKVDDGLRLVLNLVQ